MSAQQENKIPRPALRRLIALGVINSVPSSEDESFLRKLEMIWGDRTLLRQQIVKFRKTERQSLIETCDLGSRWERWLHSRLKADRPTLGRSAATEQLVSEVKKYFPIEGEVTDEEIRHRIGSLRRRLRNARYYAKKGGIQEEG